MARCEENRPAVYRWRGQPFALHTCRASARMGCPKCRWTGRADKGVFDRPDDAYGTLVCPQCDTPVTEV